MAEKAEIIIDEDIEPVELLGMHDQNLRYIEREFNIKVVLGDRRLLISGERDDVVKASRLFSEFSKVVKKLHTISLDEVRTAVKRLKEGEREILPEVILVTPRGKRIKPRTAGQKAYIEAIKSSDLVLAIGPAGTGKTYLAMAMAVNYLENKDFSRIILTRPAVEAGEKLGFLPGTLYEKIDPYLRPLYDALYDMMDVDKFHRLMERGIIEVIPLAYMRGRTLNDSIIVLDEAQNTTYEQMKMFLTRIGFGSKAIVTGDVTQIDLPKDKYSGLNEVREILKSVEGIKIVYLTDKDVVRHELVQKIVKAYERHERAKNRG